MIKDLAIDGKIPQASVDSPRTTRSQMVEKGSVGWASFAMALDASHEEDCELAGSPTNLLTQLADTMPIPSPDVFSLLMNPGPATMKEALSGNNAHNWKPAIDEEIGNLEAHQTWDIVMEVPKGIKPITARMVLQEKIDAFGRISRYKARLVAHGFKQIYGQHFNVAYAPLVSLATIRMIFTYAAIKDLEIDQMDVIGAFLESNLKEEIYVILPRGCISDENGRITIDINASDKKQITVRLNKSIYGLKQSAFEWYDNIHKKLLEYGLLGTKYDAGIYYKKDPFLVVIIWVDDISITGARLDVDLFKTYLGKQYKMKNLGPILDYLGMKIVRNREKRTICLDQSAYIDKFLRRFGMENCRREKTPMSEKYMELTEENTSDEDTDRKLYQEMIGSLNYAAICTRPDTSFTVGFLGRFAANPKKKHLSAVHRLFRYLRHTKDYGLLLGGSSSTTSLGSLEELTTYADASFANDKYKSTSGISIFLNDSPILWRSIKQKITAKSTADAEFTAISMAADEAGWLSRLGAELGIIKDRPLKIINDSEVAIRDCNLEQHQPISRHVGIKHSWIIDEVRLGRLVISYVPTAKMISDGLTKALGRILHDKMIRNMRLQTTNIVKSSTKMVENCGLAELKFTATNVKGGIVWKVTGIDQSGLIMCDAVG
jgi:hypothetical protein